MSLPCLRRSISAPGAVCAGRVSFWQGLFRTVELAPAQPRHCAKGASVNAARNARAQSAVRKSAGKASHVKHYTQSAAGKALYAKSAGKTPHAKLPQTYNARKPEPACGRYIFCHNDRAVSALLLGIGLFKTLFEGTLVQRYEAAADRLEQVHFL